MPLKISSGSYTSISSVSSLNTRPEAAGHHDGERLVQLHAELPDRAFDAAEEVVVESGLHRGLRACGENGFRLGDFHLGQLGRLALGPPCRAGSPIGDQAAGDHALVIDLLRLLRN